MFGIHEKRAERTITVLLLLLVFTIVAIWGISVCANLPVMISFWIETVILAMGILCLVTVLLFMRRQEKRLEEATDMLYAFMNGDDTIRLVSSEEGATAKFFEEINHMALSLHTHLEREKDSKEFLKSTISDISHQLKTPIAAIRMYNEIIEEEKVNPETVEDFAKKTEKSLDRMEILIQNLLKITRLDAGSIMLEKKEFDVVTLLEEIVEEYHTVGEHDKKRIEIRAKDCESEALVFADQNWTAECVQNLIQNALHHTHEGDSIEISCVKTPVFVRIKVQDSGDGIHPEDLHHIFKRFYRSRFSQNTQGIGLGLSLVKAIMEAHEGVVSVDSTLGEGSTFYLDFPLT